MARVALKPEIIATAINITNGGKMPLVNLVTPNCQMQVPKWESTSVIRLKTQSNLN